MNMQVPESELFTTLDIVEDPGHQTSDGQWFYVSPV